MVLKCKLCGSLHDHSMSNVNRMDACECLQLEVQQEWGIELESDSPPWSRCSSPCLVQLGSAAYNRCYGNTKSTGQGLRTLPEGM